MTSDQIIERLGGTVEVARLCACTPQAVSQWFGIDKKERQRGIPKARLMYLKAIRPAAFKGVKDEDIVQQPIEREEA